MRCSQRAGHVPLVDHRGNIALRRALGNGPHVDAGVAERAEELGRHARQSGHVVADDGNDAAITLHVDALNLALLQFERKGLTDDLLHPRRMAGRHGKADRVLGTGLGDQDDRDASAAQCAEQPVGRARHADHAGALEVDQGHVVHGGHALDLIRAVAAHGPMREPGAAGLKVFLM